MSARSIVSLVAAVVLTLLAGLQWVLFVLMTERSTWSILVPPLATLAAILGWFPFILARRAHRSPASRGQ